MSEKVEPTLTDALPVIKRLRRHQQDLFAFLHRQGVPFENHHAERSIRPAVILRKNSYGNRSEQGTDCRAVMMSVFRTLNQRGHDPMNTIISAVKTTWRLVHCRHYRPNLLQSAEVLQSL